MAALLKHRYISHGLKFLLAFAILAWLLKSGKIDFEALHLVWQPHHFTIILTIIFLGYVFVAVRWRSLLESRDIFISRFTALRLTLIALFFNFALPGGVSGDIVKAYYISKDQKDQRWPAAVSVFIDRFLGVTAMITLALIIMTIDCVHVFSNPTLLGIYFAIWGLFVFAVTSAILLFTKCGYESPLMMKLKSLLSGHEKAVRLLETGHSFGRMKKTIARALLLSFAGQMTSTLMFIYAGHLIAPEVRWPTYFICVPLGMMLTALPISPGGVGVGQAAFYFLFNLYTGEKSDLGPTLMTIYQMFSFLCGLAGAGFYLQYKSEAQQYYGR